MQITGNLLKLNSTYKYLYPCLKTYNNFMDYMKGLRINSVGIKDQNVLVDYPCLFILLEVLPVKHNDALEKSSYTNRLVSFLNWFREKEFYVTDYIYYTDTERSNLHMVVVKFPVEYTKVLPLWRKGQYSEMYSEADIKYLFNKSPLQDVLFREKSYISTFVDRVNKDYKTNATVEDFKDAELDYPPFIWDEIFNYKID